MTLESVDGFIVYKDHAIIGNGTTNHKNAIVPGWKPTKLIFPTQVQGVDVTEVSDFAFFGYENVTEIQLPSKLKVIGLSAFDTMKFRTEVNLPDSLEYIGRRAFAASFYRSIHIPAKVSYLGSSPFGTNELLSQITISSENKHYIVTPQNCIYNYMKTRLIQAPTNLNNLTLESTLVEIGYLSIEMGRMKELIFPVTFSRMLDYASINSCQSLTTIYFLGNLIQLANTAITICENLQNIYYYGTVKVNVKFFQFDQEKIDDLNIRLCSGYRGSTFATISNFVKEGVCPDVNCIKTITIMKKQQREPLIYITLFLIQ